jgi:DNA-binding response OmpR family regulator
MGTRISRRRTTVLVLTGDAGLLRLTQSILEPACTVIGRAPTGASADIHAETADIVIIDAESVDQDVISTARRAYSDARIIVLCREFREAECVAILDADADYLPRPFRAQDLAARVRVAELRRFNRTGRSRYYRNGSLIIDLFDRHVLSEGRSIDLSPSETKVLMLLASRPGIPVAYDRILAAIGASVSASGRQALRNLVLRLRRRIERDLRCPELVLTEPRFGYRLAEPRAEQARQSAHYCSGYGIVG